MTTDDALAWAKTHDCYIEVFADGSVEVQPQYSVGRWDLLDQFHMTFHGNSIVEVVQKVRRYWRQHMEPELKRREIINESWKERIGQ